MSLAGVNVAAICAAAPPPGTAATAAAAVEVGAVAITSSSPRGCGSAAVVCGRATTSAVTCGLRAQEYGLRSAPLAL